MWLRKLYNKIGKKSIFDFFWNLYFVFIRGSKLESGFVNVDGKLVFLFYARGVDGFSEVVIIVSFLYFGLGLGVVVFFVGEEIEIWR